MRTSRHRIAGKGPVHGRCTAAGSSGCTHSVRWGRSCRKRSTHLRGRDPDKDQDKEKDQDKDRGKASRWRNRSLVRTGRLACTGAAEAGSSPRTANARWDRTGKTSNRCSYPWALRRCRIRIRASTSRPACSPLATALDIFRRRTFRCEGRNERTRPRRCCRIHTHSEGGNCTTAASLSAYQDRRSLGGQRKTQTRAVQKKRRYRRCR